MIISDYYIEFVAIRKLTRKMFTGVPLVTHSTALLVQCSSENIIVTCIDIRAALRHSSEKVAAVVYCNLMLCACSIAVRAEHRSNHVLFDVAAICIRLAMFLFSIFYSFPSSSSSSFSYSTVFVQLTLFKTVPRFEQPK